MGGFLSRTDDGGGTSSEFDVDAQKAVLNRDTSVIPPMATGTTNQNLISLLWGSNLYDIYDSSGGAAVSCLGHAFQSRINDAIIKTMDYSATTSFGSNICGRLCQRLLDSTRGIMGKVVTYNSGSEAVEASVKLVHSYHRANGEPNRINWISREQSYHGATGWALALSGIKARREDYEPLMKMGIWHKVSSCFEYLQRDENMSIEEFVRRKKDELEKKFQELGVGTVAGFICEPIVGAALGCAPAPAGYLKAMQDVCHKYGALFIVDEIMCGMGRTGKSLHAFLKHEGVRPDILLIGKGMAAGMEPMSAMLCSQGIVDVLEAKQQVFNHGHTFQNNPRGCAAAFEVLDIFEEYNLLENVEIQGKKLKNLMRQKLERLPHISPIRGDGLFLGFSLIKDKATKESFDQQLHVAAAIQAKGWQREYGIYVYPGTGSAEDGYAGDHLIIAPPFNITADGVERLVQLLERLLVDYFEELNSTMMEK